MTRKELMRSVASYAKHDDRDGRSTIAAYNDAVDFAREILRLQTANRNLRRRLQAKRASR